MNGDSNNEAYSVREQFGGQSPFGSAASSAPAKPVRDRSVRIGEGESVRRSIPLNRWYLAVDFLTVGKRVLRRAWLAAVVAVPCFAVGAVAAKRLFTTAYSAQSVLLYRKDQAKRIRPGPESAFALTPLSQNTVVKMITLPEAVRDAVDEAELTISPGALAGHVEVRPEKASEIVQLRVAGLGDGDLAVRAVNALAQAAVRRNREFYAVQIREMHDGFAARAAEAEERLSVLDGRIQAFQLGHRFLEPQAEHQAYLDQVSTMSQRLSAARLALQALDVRIAKYRELIAGLPDQVVRESYEDNPLKRRLTNTEVALLQARTQYGPKNPRVLQLESEIQEMRKAISDKVLDVAMEKTYERNPLKDQFSSDLLTLEAEREGAAKQVESLQAEADQLTARFDPMPARDLEYRSLLAERTIAEDFVNTLRRSTEDASLALRLDLADLEVIESATDPGRERSPLAIVVAPAAAGAGAMGILVLLVLMELADPRIRTVRQLDLRYRIPCVADIPFLRPGAPAGGADMLAYCRRLADVVPLGGEEGRRGAVVGWIGVSGGEGVSRLCSEYAAYMAARGLAVARVCWAPPSAPSDGIPGAPLEAYLREEAAFETLSRSEGGVDVFAVSGPVPDLTELVGGMAMRRLRDALASGYDLVCLDLPAVAAEPAAPALARSADCLLVTVAGGRTCFGPLNRALENLCEGGKGPFGFLLNHPARRRGRTRAAGGGKQT